MKAKVQSNDESVATYRVPYEPSCGLQIPAMVTAAYPHLFVYTILLTSKVSICQKVWSEGNGTTTYQVRRESLVKAGGGPNDDSASLWRGSLETFMAGFPPFNADTASDHY